MPLTIYGSKSPNTKKKKPAFDRKGRGALIKAIQASARANAKPGPSAARSQDFLYDKHGLPK